MIRHQCTIIDIRRRDRARRKFVVDSSLLLLAGLCAIGLVWLALSGCAPMQPPAAAVSAPIPPLVPPEAAEVPPDPLAGLPATVQQAYTSGQWHAVRDGFAIFYPYKPDDMAVVSAAPEHQTEIELGGNEHITSLAVGDPVRWDVKPSGSRILVKPCPQGCQNNLNVGAAAGQPIPTAPKVFQTNLIADTTRYSHHFTLKCGGKPMESFVLWYPYDIKAAQQARAEALRKAESQSSNDTTTNLNHAYAISGPNVAWKPDAAFDDGTREWVHFPSTAPLEADMPTLYVKQGQAESLVNWTPAGNGYYVVDRLYRDAVLTVGTGKDRPEVHITAEAK